MSRLKPGEEGRHVTFCRICEAFCGLTADVVDGRIVTVLPDRDNPHSRGHVCIKGTTFHGIVHDPDRITRPMRCTGAAGVFEPVSWDDAMDDIATRLAAIMREDGADAVANYIGNPTAFSNGAQTTIRPFLAHFGIWKMFSAATQDVTSRMAASYLLYGSAFRFAIPDLPRCDFLLIFGANPLVSHGSTLTAPRIRDDLNEIARRGRVVVIDPRRTETAERYEHVPIVPDTDAWMLAAMIHVLFVEGRVDEARLTRETVGWTRLRDAVGSISPDVAAMHCGVPAARIKALALEFSECERAAAYSRTGLCRGNFSTLANTLVDALNIVSGKFGALGGWVFGDFPVEMSAVRPAGLEIVETRFGPKPYVAKNLHFSMFADEILTPGKGRVRAFLIEFGNIAISAPGGRRLAEALQSLDLFVSHDLYMNETNRFADYILPGASFLERADIPTIAFPHMIRPYAQYTDAVIAPLGESRNEDHFINDLSRRLHDLLSADPGLSGYSHAVAPFVDPLATIDGLLRRGGTFVEIDGERAALTVDLLKAHVHGVVVADELTCTNSLSKIVHKDGMIRLWDPMLDPEVERMTGTPPPRPDGLRLFSMRSMQSINSWMHNVERLVRNQRPMLLMNPVDAASRLIEDGDLVRVTSSVGSVDVHTRVTDEVASGAVCYPHGWRHQGSWRRANAVPSVNINILADPRAGDQISASSLLDGIEVVVSPLPFRTPGDPLDAAASSVAAE